MSQAREVGKGGGAQGDDQQKKKALRSHLGLYVSVPPLDPGGTTPSRPGTPHRRLLSLPLLLLLRQSGLLSLLLVLAKFYILSSQWSLEIPVLGWQRSGGYSLLDANPLFPCNFLPSSFQVLGSSGCSIIAGASPSFQ